MFKVEVNYFQNGAGIIRSEPYDELSDYLPAAEYVSSLVEPLVITEPDEDDIIVKIYNDVDYPITEYRLSEPRYRLLEEDEEVSPYVFSLQDIRRHFEIPDYVDNILDVSDWINENVNHVGIQTYHYYSLEPIESYFASL